MEEKLKNLCRSEIASSHGHLILNRSWLYANCLCGCVGVCLCENIWPSNLSSFCSAFPAERPFLMLHAANIINSHKRHVFEWHLDVFIYFSTLIHIDKCIYRWAIGFLFVILKPILLTTIRPSSICPHLPIHAYRWYWVTIG